MFRAYESFLNQFQKQLDLLFLADEKKILCKKGCCYCCKNGDYPLSQLEMSYLMFGFSKLDKELHDVVRANIKALLSGHSEKEYICPFLVDGSCSVYYYRPLICRIHGIAFMRDDGIINLPYCAELGLNYADSFDGKTVDFKGVQEDLRLHKLVNKIKNIEFGEIRSMIDWFKK